MGQEIIDNIFSKQPQFITPYSNGMFRVEAGKFVTYTSASGIEQLQQALKDEVQRQTETERSVTKGIYGQTQDLTEAHRLRTGPTALQQLIKHLRKIK